MNTPAVFTLLYPCILNRSSCPLTKKKIGASVVKKEVRTSNFCLCKLCASMVSLFWDRNGRAFCCVCLGPWTSMSPKPEKANVRTNLLIITSSSVIFWVIPCAKWLKERPVSEKVQCKRNFPDYFLIPLFVRLVVNYYPRKQRKLCGACHFSVHNFTVVSMDFLTNDVYSCPPNSYKHYYWMRAPLPQPQWCT